MENKWRSPTKSLVQTNLSLLRWVDQRGSVKLSVGRVWKMFIDICIGLLRNGNQGTCASWQAGKFVRGGRHFVSSLDLFERRASGRRERVGYDVAGSNGSPDNRLRQQAFQKLDAVAFWLERLLWPRDQPLLASRRRFRTRRVPRRRKRARLWERRRPSGFRTLAIRRPLKLFGL